MLVDKLTGKWLETINTRIIDYCIVPVLLLEATSKKDFGSRSRRSRVSTRRHTQVCRGRETKTQRRDWAKRLF